MKILWGVFVFCLCCATGVRSFVQAGCRHDALERNSTSVVGIALEAIVETFQGVLTPIAVTRLNLLAQSPSGGLGAVRTVRLWSDTFNETYPLRGMGQYAFFEFLTYLFFLESRDLLCTIPNFELNEASVAQAIRSPDLFEHANQLGFPRFHAEMLTQYLKRDQMQMSRDELEQLSFLFLRFSDLHVNDEVCIAYRHPLKDFWPSRYETGFRVVKITKMKRLHQVIVEKVTIENKHETIDFYFNQQGVQIPVPFSSGRFLGF